MYAAKDSDPLRRTGRTGNQLNVQLQDQPLIHASLGFNKINKLIINNKVVSPQYDSDKLLTIDLEETK